MSHEPDPTSVRSLSYIYLCWLSNQFPLAFDISRRPPLVRGVARLLLADARRPAWASAAVVQDALAKWTRHPLYRRHVLRRHPRVDLAGRPVSRVAPWEWRVTAAAQTRSVSPGRGATRPMTGASHSETSARAAQGAAFDEFLPRGGHR